MTLDELIDINDQALNDPPSHNYENVDFDSSTDDMLANINKFDSSIDDVLANINKDDFRSTQGNESNVKIIIKKKHA